MKVLQKVLGVSLGVALATSLQAGSLEFGLTSAKALNGSAQTGFSLSTIAPFYSPTKSGKLKLGFGIGTDFFALDDTKLELDSAIGVLANIDVIAEYSFTPKTHLLVGVGYGVGQLNEDTFQGLNYHTNLEYDISKNYGVGVKYTHNDVDLTLADATGDLDIVSIYLKYMRD